MQEDRITASPVEPAVIPATTPPSRHSVALTILSIVVAIDTVLILALGVFVGYLWGQRNMYPEEMIFGMPSQEDEEIWMLADQMAMEVGYLIVDGDIEAYLDLYEAGDSSVDLASVQADFEEVAEKATEAQGNIEYMSDMMPIVYEDEDTGETIVRITVSGMDYRTGTPSGGRLTIHILYDDGDMTLTGREGRDLSTTSTMW